MFPRSKVFPACALSLALVGLAGCATALGPGFLIERQEVRIGLGAGPEPALEVTADYRMRNVGNQPLDSLEVRLPGRRFRTTASAAVWDDRPLALAPSPENLRHTRLTFPATWKVGEAHSLRFSFQISSGDEEALGFSRDAFYLPSEGWAPQFPPPRGLFGFGGVPPRRWELVLRVPEDFLVHASGRPEKRSGRDARSEYHFAQASVDPQPFVVAGRYRETTRAVAPGLEVHIWTRGAPGSESFEEAGKSLAAMLAGYDALFGSQVRPGPALWIVECPTAKGCLPGGTAGYGPLLFGPGPDRSAALVSRDAVVVDREAAGGRLEVSAGPALAAGWLGYGQNPGFYEQQPPLSALPAFAAAVGRESAAGPAARLEVIGRALAAIPRGGETELDPPALRAKNLLLFYALEDLVGREAFRKGLQHMLYARQGRGFDVRDLISALEEEAHRPVGPFVRRWVKGPGVPDEFRERYAQSTARQESLAQEATE